MQTVNSKQNEEETDGIVTDAILQKISEFLKKNIDSLNLPTMLKNALKKIKSLFFSTDKRPRDTKKYRGDQ